MKYLTLLCVLFSSIGLHSASDYLKGYPDIVTPTKNTKIVAIIDSGFDFKSRWYKIHNKKKNEDTLPILRPKLCDKEHRDFTGTNMEDENGHGTHIAGLVSTNI